ncbi:hypothetical protein GLAREA_02212 [Glarea lozoyensis ATCC 20868]|uniref:Uncharacterized protein n=1 Tax=Glarea lozoyensis (strain ATCC 20868 / MF5171) TaxID=1116229 RepID=S3CKP4_GLAL2|nr:uncharacterized protein GLAREA_02212 [Glarea lozoyensis ATCC 20868]EPE26300.1 hypothetical protein GLAREA_02212 [Glarea lozoyensis ATCC 20868]
MQLFWYRILPFLSLLISIFVLIVIILINVGGVNSGHSNSLDYNHVQNGAFRLVKWRYNATPTQQSSSSTRGTYDLAAEIFLNRICTGSSWGTTRGSLHGAYPPTSCYNTRLDVLSPSSLKSSGYTEAFRRLTNFNFDDVYLTSPFALYVVAAITCFAMMFLSVVESFKGYKKGTGKGLRIAGLVCTALTWLFLLVASTLTTQLSLRLRNQIASQTRFSSNVRTLGPYGNAPGTEVWQRLCLWG